MSLLDVTILAENVARVSVFADDVLYRDQGDGSRIYAMSLIGQEQSIRVISGAIISAMNESTVQPVVVFSGPNTTVRGRWSIGWYARTAVLAEPGQPRAVHLVATPPDNVRSIATRDENAPQVIIAREPTTLALEEAIYRKLMLAYTTPIIPVDAPGQPTAESEAGRAWRKEIVAEILRSHWIKLRTHPDQHGSKWGYAGLLNLTQAHLDALVSNLVRRKRLTIPSRKEIACVGT